MNKSLAPIVAQAVLVQFTHTQYNHVKNQISMQNLHMTIDNTCSIEFDLYDFFAKDLLTKKQDIISSNSRSELYHSVHVRSHQDAALAVYSSSCDMWHRPLSHPVFFHNFLYLVQIKVQHTERHMRLPFSTSKLLLIPNNPM
ncbi:hypothetical protein GQ55_5G384700 [Panicum hallii var. hallii]|uniref:Uncharacterized protein n=1 Tax=Panicum hallii var. hallii TaxID=1504633 RepID=A0A2T7DMW3_9POAL|nr:hypothetical protein GQ55_5G384700 [Panicum hallii var. hallii]